MQMFSIPADRSACMFPRMYTIFQRVRRRDGSFCSALYNFFSPRSSLDETPPAWKNSCGSRSPRTSSGRGNTAWPGRCWRQPRPPMPTYCHAQPKNRADSACALGGCGTQNVFPRSRYACRYLSRVSTGAPNRIPSVPMQGSVESNTRLLRWCIRQLPWLSATMYDSASPSGRGDVRWRATFPSPRNRRINKHFCGHLGGTLHRPV